LRYIHFGYEWKNIKTTMVLQILALLLRKESFGYLPLLGLGGTKKVENLKTVKLIEHILIVTESMGPIESQETQF